MSPHQTPGGRKATDDTEESTEVVTDPVCHMEIKPSEAAGTSTHGRHTYHFCSGGCKNKFDRDPHRYLGDHSH